jgi:O-antigen ligase
MDLYRSGIEVFKKYPYFGTGNKNYGFETCYGEKKKDLYLWPKITCSSHPHQIYFDFLAEHGFIGSIIILSIFFKLIFDLLKKISINRNKLQFASFIYILIVFIPILPSGAFFSDYLLTLFFINFSLLFCVNKNSNLFCKNN